MTPTPFPLCAQADPRVVKLYERHLVASELHGLGDNLLERFQETEALLLQGGGAPLRVWWWCFVVVVVVGGAAHMLAGKQLEVQF